MGVPDVRAVANRGREVVDDVTGAAQDAAGAALDAGGNALDDLVDGARDTRNTIDDTKQRAADLLKRAATGAALGAGGSLLLMLGVNLVGVYVAYRLFVGVGGGASGVAARLLTQRGT